MPIYFALWKLNSTLTPPLDPKARVQQEEAFLALYRAQVKRGVLKEAHAFVGADRGYAISGDVSAETMQEAVAAWFPFITFEIHQTVRFPKALEATIALAKERAALMK